MNMARMDVSEHLAYQTLGFGVPKSDGDMGTLSTAKVQSGGSHNYLYRGLFSFNCGWYQPKMGMLINPHGDIEILIDLQKRDTNHTCMHAWGWWWKLRLSISIKSINIYFLWLRNNSLMKSISTSSSTLIQQVHLWLAMNCLVTHEATKHLVASSGTVSHHVV